MQTLIQVSYSNPNHILRLEDKILIENMLFINKSPNSLLAPIFNDWVTFCSDIHNYLTVSSSSDNIFKPSYRTDSYGKIIQNEFRINQQKKRMINKTSFFSIFCTDENYIQQRLCYI